MKNVSYSCDFCQKVFDERLRAITLEVEGWQAVQKDICMPCLDELGVMPGKNGNWKEFYRKFLKAWAQ